MLDTYASRPGWLDSLLTAAAHVLVGFGINANSLTYFALLSGIAAGLLFYTLHPVGALLCLSLSGLADAVDGRVARLGAGSTPWGGVLDLVFDRIVEAAVLLGIALPYPHLYVPALVLAVTWYVNLCVFLAVGAASERQREKVIVYSPGLVERGEAIFFAAFAGLWPQWAAPVGYLYATLEVITATQRFLAGRRELSQ
ncbi:MAG: CDP-alcohol phosphatidyltransferase family protein [Deltaproteobacteria bacterium]|nr:CDP-alcohol phosphatidyltransferase family protein [Deltaproteobacteria bacterium]